MQCRPDCGACCREISITRPFSGMPRGKPAGVACVHLTSGRQCGLYGDPRRPECCAAFAPDPAICGTSREQAELNLRRLECLTLPG